MHSEETVEESNRNDDSDIIRNELSKGDPHLRRVSFPENDTDLVTGYLEPVDPLRLAINVDKKDLLKAYELSCQKHKTIPIQTVVDQIKEFNTDHDRIDTLNLSSVSLTCCGCESLEEIFKRVQFNNIDLTDSGLTNEMASVLFDMFEYYESAVRLNISSNFSLGIRGWQACARYIKKSNTLEELEARDVKFTEIEAECLMKPLVTNHCLQVLKLENCNLNGNYMRSLVNALTTNGALKELYLADNKLGIFDATLLGTLLKSNRNLQVLDISNNQIQDAGMNQIMLGLCNNKWIACLEVLVVWNNCLSSSCSVYIDKLLKGYRGLTTLNIGCNNLHDIFISDIKDSLKQNQNLLRLGLQSTKLSCTSALLLAEALKMNTTLERIDLRENNILVPGLRALLDSLEVNQYVMQIDLNEASFCGGADEFDMLIQEINSKCTSHKFKVSSPVTGSEPTKLTTLRGTPRKISLTCQTLTQEPFVVSPLLSEPKKVGGKLRSPAPSPIPSPVSSPVPIITKSRFSVSRVSETEFGTPRSISRFTVTVTEPPKSVSSNNGSVTVGFDCSSQETGITASLSCCTLKDTSSADNIPASTVDSYPGEEKPMTSLEKLLNLFQTPATLFTRSSQTLQSNPVMKPRADFKSSPLSDSNVVGKSANTTNLPSLPTPDEDAQSIKENISPEHSLTLSSSKFIKPPSDAQEKPKNDQSALDNRGFKKGDLEHAQLYSSSEDSDSGFTALESSVSSNTSTTDAGISDEGIAGFECAGKPTDATPVSLFVTDTHTDSSLIQQPNTMQSDLTNNNCWKPPTADTLLLPANNCTPDIN